MYLPAATVASAMATDSTEEELLLLNPEVTSSTASSIYIRWTWETQRSSSILGFKVHYHRVASNYVQNSNMLSPTTDSYGIRNLVADTYYKVCVAMYRNDTANTIHECVDASTTSWHIPVSIGSSIGAVLALSIIVLIVLLSRCPNLVRQQRTAAAESSKYDSMSSHYHDDRHEMSDTTTHCHDDDVFSQSSECEGSHDSKRANYKAASSNYHHYHHHHHYSPKSLAERVCTGNRMLNGVGKHHTRVHVPLGRVGRTFSLTDRRHPNGQSAYKSRQARLAHFHANFHSIQSEPGNIPARTGPHVSITDLPTSSGTNSGDLSTPRSLPHHSSMPTTCTTTSSGNSISKGPSPSGPSPPCSGCSSRTVGYRDTGRHMYRIESEGFTSEPSVVNKHSGEVKPRGPILKNVSRTLHMSIENDTFV